MTGAGRIVAALVLSLGAAALPSCFSPQQPGCAFSCATDGLCPSGYVCGGDGVCHRRDGQGTCDITPADAAPDGGSSDAGQLADRDGG